MTSGNNTEREFTMMHFVENRLATFKDWPFQKGCACTPVKMAEAGFYHRPSDLAPDLAKCYVCQKELEGWEPTDDPWTEHRNHAKDCDYLKLQDPKNITVVQLERLESKRQINILRKVADGKIQEYKDYTKEARLELESLSS